MADLKLDNMEYSSNGLALNAYATDIISAIDCSDISSWTDQDGGSYTGSSTQVTFDNQSTFKFYAGDGVNTSYARRRKVTTTITNKFIFEIKLYHKKLGTIANVDYFLIYLDNGEIFLALRFATDGLFVNDGSTWNEVGTNIVSTDTWQSWKFVVTATTASSATCDIYLNNILQATGVDCSYTGGSTSGDIELTQYGYTTSGMETYVDLINTRSYYISSNSESSIKTQGNYSLKCIADITTSLNKTITYIASIGDLTGVKNLKFDIRSNRTGSNIKIGIHDTGGTTTEITPNIITANIFQTINWDISSVSDANKDNIDSIIITILNADSENTFYIDNFQIATCIDIIGLIS